MAIEERRFGLGDVLSVGGAIVGGIVSGGNPAAIQAGATIGGTVGGAIDDGKNSGSNKTKNPYGYDNGTKIRAPVGYNNIYKQNLTPYKATPSQKKAFDDLLKLQREQRGSSFTGPRKAIEGPFNNDIDPEYAIADLVASKAPTDIANAPASAAQFIPRAAAILQLAGLSSTPSETTGPVGNDFTGQTIYAASQLANDQDTTQGSKFIRELGMTIGAIGAFTDFKEAQSFVRIGDRASDAQVHTQLDKYKAENNFTGFINSVGNGSSEQAKVTGFKLFEHWNSMSAAQKSLALSGAAAQSFTFSDGTTAETRRVTPQVPGVPAMTLADGLELASRGTNVAPQE